MNRAVVRAHRVERRGAGRASEEGAEGAQALSSQSLTFLVSSF